MKPITDVGSVLYTMRKIPVLPDFHLSDIHRQAAENPIIKLSMDIRNGRMPRIGKMGKDVLITHSASVTADILARASQVICGTNKFRHELNAEIREFNNYTDDFPRAGEKLICEINNQSKMIFNGSTIETLSDAVLLNPSEGIFAVDYRGEDGIEHYGELFHAGIMSGKIDKNKISPRMRKEYIFADYGYAITVHKSQGSTYKNTVVFNDAIGRSKDDYTRWWYTAVTRSSDKLIIGM